MSKIRVTVWNENYHERKSEKIAKVYPCGIHAAIADGLAEYPDFEIRTATLDMENCGLDDETLKSTDVLIFWAHCQHEKLPDELAAKISMLDNEIKELEAKHAAVLMAQEAIEAAHESMRGNVSPILTAKASQLFSLMTDGKYKGLYVDNDLLLSFLEEGSAEYRSVDYLSSGASDAAYLALRITLTEYLYEEKPTLIFDDAFSRLDDERLARVGKMLKALSSEYQIMVFTCHDREVAILQPDALIKMFGRAPKKVGVYSLHLGREIEIFF